MDRMELKMLMTPEGLYVDSYTDAERLAYRRMCRTSPRQVVKILRTGRIDGRAEKINVSAALVAVSELTKDETEIPRAQRLKTWNKLIDVGVLEVVVGGVVSTVLDMDVALQQVPEPLKERARNEVRHIMIRAPYFTSESFAPVI